MQQVYEYVFAHPGAIQSEVCETLSHLGKEHKIRRVLANLVDSGHLSVERGVNNAKHFYPTGKVYEAPAPVERKRKRRGKQTGGKMPTMFIYGIKIVGHDPIKIGITKSIKTRLNSLQTGHFERYYIVYAALVNDAEWVEAELHNAFADRRLGGEWFDITVAELIAEVESNGYLA